MKGNILPHRFNWVLFFFLLGTVASNGFSKELSVASYPEEVCPLKIGATVPPLSLKTAENRDFDLDAALGKKPTILIFYRGGW